MQHVSDPFTNKSQMLAGAFFLTVTNGLKGKAFLNSKKRGKTGVEHRKNYIITKETVEKKRNHEIKAFTHQREMNWCFIFNHRGKPSSTMC